MKFKFQGLSPKFLNLSSFDYCLIFIRYYGKACHILAKEDDEKKTIKISKKTHKLLSKLASKHETFNDVIVFLINYYYEDEDYYNERIRHFEKGDYSGTRKVDLNAFK